MFHAEFKINPNLISFSQKVLFVKQSILINILANIILILVREKLKILIIDTLKHPFVTFIYILSILAGANPILSTLFSLNFQSFNIPSIILESDDEGITRRV